MKIGYNGLIEDDNINEYFHIIKYILQISINAQKILKYKHGDGVKTINLYDMR